MIEEYRSRPERIESAARLALEAWDAAPRMCRALDLDLLHAMEAMRIEVFR